MAQKIEFSLTDSKIVSNHEDVVRLYDLLGFNFNDQFTLLYRGSRDGFTASAFHAKCNGYANTLTIFNTTKSNVFGGYTTAVWSSSNGYKHDPNAFIFTLKNKYDKPMMLKVSHPSYAIYDAANYGPTFGGHAIYNAADFKSGSSYTSVANHYTYTYTLVNHQAIFNGEYNFITDEVEVYVRV